MPHVLIQLATGHAADDKDALTDRIVSAVTESLGSTADQVSVALVEVPLDQWMSTVYGPDIAGREAHLTKRPGYGPLA